MENGFYMICKQVYGCGVYSVCIKTVFESVIIPVQLSQRGNTRR